MLSTNALILEASDGLLPSPSALMYSYMKDMQVDVIAGVDVVSNVVHMLVRVHQLTDKSCK